MEDMDLTIKVTDYKSSGMRRSTLTFRKLLLVVDEAGRVPWAKSEGRRKQRWREGEEEKKEQPGGEGGGGRSWRKRAILNPESSQLISH